MKPHPYDDVYEAPKLKPSGELSRPPGDVVPWWITSPDGRTTCEHAKEANEARNRGSLRLKVDPTSCVVSLKKKGIEIMSVKSQKVIESAPAGASASRGPYEMKADFLRLSEERNRLDRQLGDVGHEIGQAVAAIGATRKAVKIGDSEYTIHKDRATSRYSLEKIDAKPVAEF